jgi:hypothetical protein
MREEKRASEPEERKVKDCQVSASGSLTLALQYISDLFLLQQPSFIQDGVRDEAKKARRLHRSARQEAEGIKSALSTMSRRDFATTTYRVR